MNLREWALPVYTVLLPLSVGMLLFLWLLRSNSGREYDHEVLDRIVRDPLLIILVTIIFAIIGAHFHLSKPFHSFLAVNNFKKSFLPFYFLPPRGRCGICSGSVKGCGD
jgi:DMSO reductase anchor subunit